MPRADAPGGVEEAIGERGPRPRHLVPQPLGREVEDGGEVVVARKLQEVDGRLERGQPGQGRRVEPAIVLVDDRLARTREDQRGAQQMRRRGGDERKRGAITEVERLAVTSSRTSVKPDACRRSDSTGDGSLGMTTRTGSGNAPSVSRSQ